MESRVGRVADSPRRRALATAGAGDRPLPGGAARFACAADGVIAALQRIQTSGDQSSSMSMSIRTRSSEVCSAKAAVLVQQ